MKSSLIPPQTFWRICCLFCFLLCYSISMAQEHTPGEEAEGEGEELFKHSIGLMISHTHIDSGIQEGRRGRISVPSFGINYNYLLSEKWVIGWHNDIIIENFIVENKDEEIEELERSRPIATMVAVSYKIAHEWGLVLGGGAEFEKNENFGLIRIGTDYGIRLSESGWAVEFALNYDMLIGAYNSINFGIGIAKLF